MNSTSSRLRTFNLIVAVLIVVLNVLTFLPFWHCGGESVSISSYVWMPTEHSSLETAMAEELGEKVNVNEIVRMPALMVLPGWIGLALCLIKSDTPLQSIATLPFGVMGLIGYLGCDALRLGSFYWLMAALSAAVIVVDLIGLTALKEK